MTHGKRAGGLLAAVLLAGCATQPMGPTARVMPAPGKPFEVFAADQTQCKQYADGEVAGGAAMSNMKQLGTAALSTALGGGLGAAVHGARGAEIGGSLGSIAGAGLGARGSAGDQAGLQGRYDLAYSQCMYARGNQVAGLNPAGRPGMPPPGVRAGLASAGPMPNATGSASGGAYNGAGSVVSR